MDPPGQHRLEYSDIFAVLTAYAIEMTLVRYRELRATIIVTDGGYEIGHAFLGMSEQDMHTLPLSGH